MLASMYVSALDAIEQSGLSLETINNNPRVALVASSGGASTESIVNAVEAMREKGLRGVGAMAVPKTMGSSVSAALATGLKIQIVSYLLPLLAPPQRTVSVMPLSSFN